jgi:peptide deformylase
MAVRIIRKDTDPVLRKKAKEIKEITPAILRLLEDMAETMDAANGVGLAAPQVGIEKRIVLVKIGKNDLLELINPVIRKQAGEEVDVEGCLSFPGLYGEVQRALEVEVEALDRHGHKKIIKGTGLLARALQHEIDHLEGVLFVDKVVKFTEK